MNEQSEPHDEGAATDPAIQEGDWLLADLVRWANKLSDIGEGVSIPATLFLGGGIVTGDVIGAKAYFKEYAKTWHTAFSRINSDVSDQMEGYFLDISSQIYDQPGAHDNPIGFVHMRNARAVYPNGQVPVPGQLWRGRLSEISGFMFGTISLDR